MEENPARFFLFSFFRVTSGSAQSGSEQEVGSKAKVLLFVFYFWSLPFWFDPEVG